MSGFNAKVSAITSILVFLMLEYLDTSVKEKLDVNRLTGLKVLGIIPDMNMIDHNLKYGLDKNV